MLILKLILNSETECDSLWNFELWFKVWTEAANDDVFFKILI